MLHDCPHWASVSWFWTPPGLSICPLTYETFSRLPASLSVRKFPFLEVSPMTLSGRMRGLACKSGLISMAVGGQKAGKANPSPFPARLSNSLNHLGKGVALCVARWLSACMGTLRKNHGHNKKLASVNALFMIVGNKLSASTESDGDKSVRARVLLLTLAGLL